MRKLLSANISRLWKNKTFWLCVAVMLIYSVVYMLNGCRQATLLSEYQFCIDEFYFQFAVSIGAFSAIFGSMFIGTEYSDGTIRNKVVTGATRTNIYLSNFITLYVVTLIIMSVWLIGALVAIPTLGIWKMGIHNLLIYLFIAVMFEAAFSAVFTFICMLNSNKAATVLISILVFLGLLIFSSMIYNSLSEPEMTSGVLITANGMEMAEPTPNPNYVSGIKRTIYEFILDALPTGQGLQMWQLEIGNVTRMICMLVSSVAITVLTTLGGIFIFKRKDLK